jgi:hypothetical protein
MNASSSAFFISPDVRFLISGKDGGVLLNIKEGKCFSINRVGAEIWKAVQNNSAHAINKDGIVSSLVNIYAISPELIQKDVSKFLEQLKSNGFLVPAAELEPSQTGNPGSLVADDFADDPSKPTAAHSERAAEESPQPSLSVSLLAFFLLLIVDFILKTGGFRKLYFKVRDFPVRSRRQAEKPAIASICAAADRATRWYLKPAWCLQRSAVTACLLRFYGIHGRLVIGCSKLPFRAHAWVEVKGVVVNDKADVRARYSTLDLL